MEDSFTPKQRVVVQAATEVFLRYGFARTTMADLAHSAGISRPALYLVFPGKDEIFAAVIRMMSEDLLADLRTPLASLPTIGEKLLFACRTWGARGYELVERYPDSKDILDLSFAAVREAFADFQALLAALVAETGRQTIASATPNDVARLMIYSIRGFTDVARDRDDFLAMLETQVRLVIRALEGEA